METETATTNSTTPPADDLSLAKRKLLLHDTLTFASLALITIVLFAVTLFLFRSFQAHRAELARRWSDRGQAALNAGKPDQAIISLRTALSYAPGERPYELLLARALGEAGYTEESYNYFTGLWETEPGDGFINLALARLSAQKKDKQAAVHFYRAAVYGTWEGDGVVRRREVRLELARYLIGQHDLATARTELLIAGGNAPDTAPLDVELGDLLREADDPVDALNYYEKAIAKKPNSVPALEQAGRLAYQLGDFARAHRLLERAMREHAIHYATVGEAPQYIAAMSQNSSRILDLQPSHKLPAAERVSRILAARAIARKRLDTCAKQFASMGASPSTLQGLSAAWLADNARSSRAALLRDAARQDSALQLVYNTEIQTSQICGPPAGDDALLLLLAKMPNAVEQ